MARTLMTRGGRRLTDADVDRLADRVETGVDIGSWKPRPGRPPLDPSATVHAPRVSARVSEAVRQRAIARARREGRTMSDVLRSLLEGYAMGDADQ